MKTEDNYFSLFYPEDKLVMFIDGSNLYAAAKALEFDIDYKLLLNWASSQGRLVRAFYYTALIDDQEYSPIRPLVDWLDYNGYTMVTKPAKEFLDENGERKLKGNMDIELAVDMMEISDYADHIMLFSGDGDFKKLVEAVQRKGVRVTVISTIKSSPPMVADELRRQADYFLDLKILAKHIERPSNGYSQPSPQFEDGHYDQDEEKSAGSGEAGMEETANESNGESTGEREFVKA